MWLSMNGGVEVLFDFAFIVYVGDDTERVEGLISGRPTIKKGVPVMVKKKEAEKLLKSYSFYYPFVPAPADTVYNIIPEVVHVDLNQAYPVSEETLVIPESESDIFTDTEFDVADEPAIVDLEPVITEEKPKQTRARRKIKTRTKRYGV